MKPSKNNFRERQIALSAKYRKQQGLSNNKSDILKDADRQAKPSGKRISDSGNIYYESRENRTDRRAGKYPMLEKGGSVRKPKFAIGDMVYSWQNKDEAFPVHRISDRGIKDGVDYGIHYQLSLKDKDGYTRNSKWMGEDSLFSTKQDKYEHGGNTDDNHFNVGDTVSADMGYGLRHKGKIKSKHHIKNNMYYVSGIGDAVSGDSLRKESEYPDVYMIALDITALGIDKDEIEAKFNSILIQPSQLTKEKVEKINSYLDMMQLKPSIVKWGDGSVSLVFKDKYEDGGSVRDKERDREIADTILKQLGGINRLEVMTGAYNFLIHPNGVSFRLKSRKANYVKIILTSKDLYDVEIGKVSGLNYKVVNEGKDLYADMLIGFIEKNTGMYLKLFQLGGETEIKSATNKPDYLFVGVFPNAYCYCDKRKEKNGDYYEIGRIVREPLSLRIFDSSSKYKPVHDRMHDDFERMENMSKQGSESPLYEHGGDISIGEKANFKVIKINYSDGDFVITNVAPHISDEVIYSFYSIGQPVNKGNADQDAFVAIESVEILSAEQIEELKKVNDVDIIKHEDGGMMGDATYDWRFDITSPAFAKGGSISSNSIYVSNRDIQNVKFKVKKKMYEVLGSQIYDGIYVKKDAIKSEKPAKPSSTHNLSWFRQTPKNVDTGREEEEIDNCITQSRVDRLRGLGLSDEEVKAVFWGYQALNENIKADGEFVGYASGLMVMQEDYVDRTIDDIEKNIKGGFYEAGLKYPDFPNYKKIFAKYGLSLNPVETVVKSYYKDELDREYQYAVWSGNGIFVSKGAGVKRYKDGKVDYDEFENISSVDFGGGYASIVCRDLNTLNAILNDFLSNEKAYLKDLDYLSNGLGGIDGFQATENGIKFEDGGMMGDATGDFRFDITSPAFSKGGKLYGIKEGDTYTHSYFGDVKVTSIEENEDDKRNRIPYDVHFVETKSGRKDKQGINGFAYGVGLKEQPFEQGGMISHGFHSGDIIYEIYKGYGIIEVPNNHDRLKDADGSDIIVINPHLGRRYLVEKSAKDFKAAVQKARNMIDENANKHFGFVNDDGDADKSAEKPVYADGGTVDEKDIVGTVLYANTGVPVKVVEYEPSFGGRIKIQRIDEFGDGTTSQWMPIKKFFKQKPVYADGGTLSSKDKFIKDMRHLKDQIHMVQLEDGTLISGKDLRYAKGGSVGEYVAVSESKDGHWVIISTPTTKSQAQEIVNMGVPKGEKGKVVTVSQAKAHKKVLGEEYLYAEGGEVDTELIDSSAKSIYDKRGMMGLRDKFLMLAQTDENEGDKATADYRRAVVKRYQDKQPKIMAKGGTTFSDKVKAVSKKLTGSKVASKYKEKYGAKYSPAEAKEAATKIVGAMVSKSGEAAKKVGRKAKIRISKTTSSIVNKYKSKK